MTSNTVSSSPSRRGLLSRSPTANSGAFVPGRAISDTSRSLKSPSARSLTTTYNHHRRQRSADFLAAFVPQSAELWWAERQEAKRQQQEQQPESMTTSVASGVPSRRRLFSNSSVANNMEDETTKVTSNHGPSPSTSSPEESESGSGGGATNEHDNGNGSCYAPARPPRLMTAGRRIAAKRHVFDSDVWQFAGHVFGQLINFHMFWSYLTIFLLLIHPISTILALIALIITLTFIVSLFDLAWSFWQGNNLKKLSQRYIDFAAERWRAFRKGEGRRFILIAFGFLINPKSQEIARNNDFCPPVLRRNKPNKQQTQRNVLHE